MIQRVSIHQQRQQVKKTHLCILNLIIHRSIRGSIQPLLSQYPNQTRARDKRFTCHADAFQTKPVGESLGRLDARRPSISRGRVVGVVEEEDGVALLLDGEEHADLWGEGCEDQGAGVSVGVDDGEDGVGKVVDFWGEAVHLEVGCL